MLLYIYGWDKFTIQSQKPHICVARWWLKKLETGSCKILSRNTEGETNWDIGNPSHVKWARAGGEKTKHGKCQSLGDGCGAAPLSHCHSALHTFCSLPLHPLVPPHLALQPPLLQNLPSSTFTCTHNRKLPRKHLIVVCLYHNHGG